MVHVIARVKVCDRIASLGQIRWCNVLAAPGVLVIRKLETRNFVKRESVDFIAHLTTLGA